MITPHLALSVLCSLSLLWSASVCYSVQSVPVLTKSHCTGQALHWVGVDYSMLGGLTAFQKAMVSCYLFWPPSTWTQLPNKTVFFYILFSASLLSRGKFQCFSHVLIYQKLEKGFPSHMIYWCKHKQQIERVHSTPTLSLPKFYDFQWL